MTVKCDVIFLYGLCSCETRAKDQLCTTNCIFKAYLLQTTSVFFRLLLVPFSFQQPINQKSLFCEVNWTEVNVMFLFYVFIDHERESRFLVGESISMQLNETGGKSELWSVSPVALQR